MPTRRSFLAAAAALPFIGKPACATPSPVDIDLTTGFDLSHSMRYLHHKHLRSLVDALSQPRFLERLTGGPHGTARVELYAWHVAVRPLLSPCLIRCDTAQADMAAFLAPLRQALGHAPVMAKMSPFGNFGFPDYLTAPAPGSLNISADGGGTNTSLAMEAGISLLSSRSASRKVLNIVTDDDRTRMTNEKEAMLVHQARAHNQGITINGLVIGDATAMDHYFHKFVRTPDGFVLSTADIPKVPEIWERKFSQDLIG